MIETERERDSLTLFAIAIVPFLVLVAWHWSYGPLLMFGDWAHYMLHADALRTGRGYRDIGYIFTNLNPYIGPPAQTPGLPLSLVPVLVLTDGARESGAYKGFMLLCALLFLFAAWKYLCRIGDRWLAAAAIAITALSLEIAFVTNTVQPDVGFCAMLWAIFWLVDGRRPWTWARVIAVAGLGLWALSFRTAALPIVPAVAIYALLHRRELGIRPMIPVAVWGVIGIAGALAVPRALASVSVLVPDPAELVANLHNALAAYPFAALDLFLHPFPWNRANDIYHVCTAAAALVGAVVWLRREWSSLLAIFAALYGAMLAAIAVQDSRYLMPLAPLGVFFFAHGVVLIIRWIVNRRRSASALEHLPRFVFAGGLAIALVALGTSLTKPRPIEVFGRAGLRPIFDFLAEANRSSPARVAFVNPRVLTWYTGIPAMGFFKASPDATIEEFRAQRITHVVLGDFNTDPAHEKPVARVVEARPDVFHRLYSQGVFTVYAFDAVTAPRP